MVGHIYKDAHLAVLVYLILGLFLFEMIGISFSVIYEDSATAYNEIISPIIIAIFGLNIIIPTLTMEESLRGNDPKWLNYVAALPGGFSSYIRSKYVFSLISMIFVNLISVILAFAIDSIADETAITDMLFYIITAADGLSFVFVAVYACFSIRFSGKLSGGILIACVVALVFAGIVYLLFGDLSIFEGDILEKALVWINEHKADLKLFSKIVFAVGIVLAVCSCELSVYMSKKTSSRLLIS